MKFTDAALTALEDRRLEAPPAIKAILKAEVETLLQSGDLQAIFELTSHNTERSRMIDEISQPRIKAALTANKKLRVAQWEYVISAHDYAVSFALRAADSLHAFKEAAYADALVPMRLYYDLD